MTDSGKSARDKRRDALLAILEHRRGMLAEPPGKNNVRHYRNDWRTLPVTLAGEALAAVEAWRTGTDTAALRQELHRCMDELLKLREQLPAIARQRFDALDDMIQAIDLRLQDGSQAVAFDREGLIDRITALGDVLIALTRPGADLREMG